MCSGKPKIPGTCFIAIFTLLQWSGTKSAVSVTSVGVLLPGPLRKFLSSSELLFYFGPNFETSLLKVYNVRHKLNLLWLKMNFKLYVKSGNLVSCLSLQPPFLLLMANFLVHMKSLPVYMVLLCLRCLAHPPGCSSSQTFSELVEIPQLITFIVYYSCVFVSVY